MCLVCMSVCVITPLLYSDNEPDSETTPTVPDTESVTTGDTMATTAGEQPAYANVQFVDANGGHFVVPSVVNL